MCITELPTDHSRYLPGSIITQTTVVPSEENIKSTSISTDTASNRTQGGRDEGAVESSVSTLAAITERPQLESTTESQLQEPEEENLITEKIQITEGNASFKFTLLEEC